MTPELFCYYSKLFILLDCTWIISFVPHKRCEVGTIITSAPILEQTEVWLSNIIFNLALTWWSHII